MSSPIPCRHRIRVAAFVAAAMTIPCAGAAQTTGPLLSSSATVDPRGPYSDRVEIIRTSYHVPHIRAQDIAAGYYALAWVQLEDYGPGVAINLLRGRGEMGKWFGPDSMNGDFGARLEHAYAIENFHRLEPETRAVYEGFAAGVNRYIETHPDEFPAGFAPRFTAYDIFARDVTFTGTNSANRFLARLARLDSAARADSAGRPVPERGGRSGGRVGADPAVLGETAGTASLDRDGDGIISAIELVRERDEIEEGSNAWAFHPSRTKSGRAILMRNPHLAWTAGYYEAHMTIPGVMDFYGDFRIGGPFGVIGGFNKDLGFATTNNAPDLEEIYELTVDPDEPDHYLFDGTSIPLTRHLVTVEWKNGNGISTETRELWRSPLGPVVHRANGKIWVVKGAADGDFRAGEQFLHMMRATSLAEWKEAMRMRSRVNSNFTYADRAGNIFYVWNASLPRLPHANGGDTTAIPAASTNDVWTRYVPWDSLPQFENPRGGYVHNENDSPFYTNMRQPLDPARWGDDFPERDLLLRSQLSLQLIDNNQKFSLEDVVRLKHSYRMLLADRVKPDLIAAVRATRPTGAVADAIAMLETWDNTASHESRGGVLFQAWWQRYTRGMPADSAHAKPWTPDAPTTTPVGLRYPERAAQAFAEAVEETARRHGRFDVPWGEVHRVRLGTTDAPVGGCGGALGCFRVLNFRTDPDGKRSVIGGDGWVLAVEFGREVPRAYSVLAYGNTNREDSPHYGDQAAMFARGEMKKVLFLPADIERDVKERYRPGR